MVKPVESKKETEVDFFQAAVFEVSGMKISPNCLLGERVGEVALLIRQRKRKMSRDWCFRVTGCYSKLKYMFEKRLEESD